MRLLAAHVPYRTDLGQVDSACTAVRHGTYSAYRYGCRCPHAREAVRLYMKRRREGRSEQGLVDACGTRRRIQALQAIGHSRTVIAAASGGRFHAVRLSTLCKQEWVTVPTHDSIRAVYASLSSRPGASARTRNWAASRGYATPIQWGADIDDPDAVPDPRDDDHHLPDGFIDEDVVERALSGERIYLTDAELIAAGRIASGRGLSSSTLSERLHMNNLAAKRLLDGELPPNRQRRARIAAELRRHPARSDRVIAAALGVAPETVSAVRRELSGRRSQIAS
jgi:hypothetical protein